MTDVISVQDFPKRRTKHSFRTWNERSLSMTEMTDVAACGALVGIRGAYLKDQK